MKKMSVILVILLLPTFLSCQNTASNDQPKELLPTTATTHPKHTNDTLLYCHIGGPPEPYYTFAEKKLGDKYGIYFTTVGCVIDDSITNFVKANNQKLFDKIQQTYPDFTEDQMLHEFQELVTLHKSLEAVFFNTGLGKRMLSDATNNKSYITTRWFYNEHSPKEYAMFIDVYKDSLPTIPTIEARIFPPSDVLLKMEDGGWNECTK